MKGKGRHPKQLHQKLLGVEVSKKAIEILPSISTNLGVPTPDSKTRVSAYLLF